MAAVPVNFQVRLSSGRRETVAAVAAMVGCRAADRSCGRGCKGGDGLAVALGADPPQLPV